MDIMTRDVVTVAPEDDVGQVARRLLDHRISGSPVVDRDGRLLGIVSEADLMRRAGDRGNRRWWLALLADRTADFARDSGTRAKDVMTRAVVTIDQETQLAEIARILERNRIKRLPVVRDGQLVGIVSRADVIRALGTVRPRYHALPSANDLQIRESILNLLRRDTATALQAVSVIVVNGTVYLWGTAETSTDKDAIRIAAEEIAGVANVHDFLSTLPEILKRV